MGHKYRAVVFDAGGTLIGYDEALGFEKALAGAFADLGVSASARRVGRLMGELGEKARSRRERIGGWSRTAEEDKDNFLWVGRFFLENLGVSEDIDAKAAVMYDRLAAGDFTDLFSDVQPVLEALNERAVRMGILSKYGPFLERNFRTLGIHRYFAFFVVSSLLGVEKPDPRIFYRAIDEAGHPPESILYVGDNPDDDVAGAQGVGLDVVLIDRFDRGSGVDCPIIQSLTELLQIVG